MSEWRTPPEVDKIRPMGPGSKSVRLWSAWGLLAVFTVAAIGGCSTKSDQISRVLEAVGADKLTLNAETKEQLDRFSATYQTYSSAQNDGDLDYFRFALRRVKSAYVSEVPDADLVTAAIDAVEQAGPAAGSLQSGPLVETALRGMLRSLDPHSDYLNQKDYHDLFQNNSGQFGGLGIEVVLEDELVKVVSPIDNTPAQRAGLRAGDFITRVNGAPIKGKTLSQAVDLMRGEPGTSIDLIIRREGVDDFPVTLVRAIITVEAVKWRREGDIGYVRVTRFTEKVESGIAKALASLSTSGGKLLKGLVLDLRANPGGLLDQSVILADSFLDAGEIVSVRGRTLDNLRYYSADQGDLARDLPMVVLVDGGSASASEIVASALQFHKRAVVLGTQSFGKGSVQTIMPLPGHGALRLTTALYYSPDGHTIQAKGVVPDIWVKSREALELQREADLPGAIAAENWTDPTLKGRPVVLKDSCPGLDVPRRPDRKDHVLGCAIEYLEAGSTQQFLANVKSAPQS